jgi:hypothetical protein
MCFRKLVFDLGNQLIVADTGNNRILEYPAARLRVRGTVKFFPVSDYYCSSSPLGEAAVVEGLCTNLGNYSLQFFANHQYGRIYGVQFCNGTALSFDSDVSYCAIIRTSSYQQLLRVKIVTPDATRTTSTKTGQTTTTATATTNRWTTANWWQPGTSRTSRIATWWYPTTESETATSLTSTTSPASTTSVLTPTFSPFPSFPSCPPSPTCPSCPSCPPSPTCRSWLPSSCPATVVPGSHAPFAVFGVLLGILVGAASVVGVGYLLYRWKKWPFTVEYSTESIVSSLRLRTQLEDDEEILDDGL